MEDAGKAGQRKTVIVVVGMPGAGKSEVANIYRRHGVAVFRSGDIVREEVAKRGLELNIENSEKVARQLREEMGRDAPARIAMEKALSLPGTIACIEGPRDMAELDCIAGQSNPILVVVTAPEEVRFRRLHGRLLSRDPGNEVKGRRDPSTMDEFRWRDRKETERGIVEVLETRKYPRYEIENSGSLGDLEKKALGVLLKAKEGIAR